MRNNIDLKFLIYDHDSVNRSLVLINIATPNQCFPYYPSNTNSNINFKWMDVCIKLESFYNIIIINEK